MRAGVCLRTAQACAGCASERRRVNAISVLQKGKEGMIDEMFKGHTMYRPKKPHCSAMHVLAVSDKFADVSHSGQREMGERATTNRASDCYRYASVNARLGGTAFVFLLASSHLQQSKSPSAKCCNACPKDCGSIHLQFRCGPLNPVVADADLKDGRLAEAASFFFHPTFDAKQASSFSFIYILFC
ncbi:hypothetical protein DL89DRAFT_61607 [Linderina pennispora]|uniref:Uncharacterized protein n=1 Tax=Linderina pennispora TaxID=61395 RepID=A0A1Y1W0A6_9FUNG|nr:uncharacterized protein DL89DRAFT_61607 [Linderina pennispora]ORX66922.1 hypothetical protein DL89DRAFT_61607 [Linderina pennispora]